MKRNAKQSGSGGRLRWGLLMATVAAFLLVPVASASAAVEHSQVLGAGEGSGWVKGEAGTEGGTPHVECHWNGELQEFDEGGEPGKPGPDPTVHKCEFTANNVGIGQGGVLMFAEHDSGSLLYGWEVDFKGGLVAPVSGCSYNEITEEFGEASAQTEGCAAVSFLSSTPIEITAKFIPEPKPEFALNATSSGEGSLECKVSGSPVACTGGEVEEEKPVELIASPNAGYESEWTTGPCAGSHSNTCSFAMPNSAVSANVAFSVAQEALSVTEGGAGVGSVVCEVGGSVEPCNGTYEYGDSVVVVATPAAENIVESITGSGSASGNCTVLGGGASGECSFTIEATSSVSVIFAPAGTKVEGEVPNTTSLTGCEAPVVLGPFVPAVNANYEGTCSLTATSTGSATELSAADLSGNETGHLVQGSYRLPSALETRATGLGNPPLEFPGTGGSYAPLSNPSVTLLTYAGPVSADNVTVRFKQHIGLHDALHSGTYSKPITLSLEQTSP